MVSEHVKWLKSVAWQCRSLRNVDFQKNFKAQALTRYIKQVHPMQEATFFCWFMQPTILWRYLNNTSTDIQT